MYQDKLKQIRRDSNQNWPEKIAAFEEKNGDFGGRIRAAASS